MSVGRPSPDTIPYAANRADAEAVAARSRVAEVEAADTARRRLGRLARVLAALKPL
jgi:hypothetical protein